MAHQKRSEVYKQTSVYCIQPSEEYLWRHWRHVIHSSDSRAHSSDVIGIVSTGLSLFGVGFVASISWYRRRISPNHECYSSEIAKINDLKSRMSTLRWRSTTATLLTPPLLYTANSPSSLYCSMLIILLFLMITIDFVLNLNDLEIFSRVKPRENTFNLQLRFFLTCYRSLANGSYGYLWP